MPYDPLSLGQDGILIVDTETGGLDAENCALVEVAAIACTANLVVLDHFQTYINPGRLTLTEKAVEIHGLTQEFLKDKPSEDEALKSFADWCMPYVGFRFSGYNCKYDLGFLHNWYLRNSFSTRLYRLPPYDIWDLAREKLGRKTPNHKLVTVSAHFGLDTNGAHGALIDCFMTLQSARHLTPVEVPCDSLELIAS